jgi:hypothetical protein
VDLLNIYDVRNGNFDRAVCAVLAQRLALSGEQIPQQKAKHKALWRAFFSVIRGCVHGCQADMAPEMHPGVAVKATRQITPAIGRACDEQST